LSESDRAARTAAQEKNSLSLPDSMHLANLKMQLEEKQAALEESAHLLEAAQEQQPKLEEGTPRSAATGQHRNRQQCAARSASGCAEATAGKRADARQGAALAEKA
jgi:hypothetical protein